MKLNDTQRKFLLGRIEKLFEETKARLLGRYFKGPHIIFSTIGQTDPLLTIEALYTWTLSTMVGSGIYPDQKTIEDLSEISGNYIDSQKLKVKNHILNSILSAKNHKEAMKSVKEHMDKASKYLEMLTANETKQVIAYATREGISRLASDMQINDPTIVFLGLVDDKLCLEENEEVQIVSKKANTWVKLKDLKVGDKLKPPFAKHNQTKNQWDGTVTKASSRLAETIKLTIDNDTEIICTPDHPVLIKSGPIFHFIEAKYITENHYIVTKDDNLHGIKQSLMVRDFMKGCNDSWDYIRDNIHNIMRDLEMLPLKDVLKKNSIPYKIGWEKYLRFIVKAYNPNLKIKRPSNFNNKKYIENKSAEIQRSNKDKISEFQKKGDLWLLSEIKSGKSIKTIFKETKIPFEYLSSRVNSMNLIPEIKARGARAAWAKHGISIAEKIAQRQNNKLVPRHSKPERECYEALVKAGYQEAIHQQKIGGMTVDMFIPSLSLVIEYDGSGHSRDKWNKGKRKFARTQSQVDYARDKRLKELGLSVFRIHSPKDAIPSSDDLKNKINEMISNRMDFLKWHV